MARKPMSKRDRQVRDINRKTGFSKDIISKGLEAGFVSEQVESFDSEKSLEHAIGRIRPAILASAGTIAGPKPPPPVPVEMETKTIEFTIDLSAMKAKTPMRAEDEQRGIDALLNRKGIRPMVTKIDIFRDYEPRENNMYETRIIIYYKGAKT